MSDSRARRVTLVTGGARRVGAAIVHAFAARGDAIVLHYGASGETARRFSEELQAQGTPVHLVEADLRDALAPQHVVEQSIKAFGHLDVVVSSASVMLRHEFDSVTVDEWDTVNHINLRAPFFLSQAAARVMQPGGSIVHMCDHLAFEARSPHLIPHQVTKAAIATLVSTLAGALAPRLRVNAVAPGLVLKPDDMSDETVNRFLRNVPLARTGTPEDVAQAILFLVEAPYVTGVVLPVDGGRHLWT